MVDVIKSKLESNKSLRIGAYHPLPDEPDITPLFDLNHNWYLPRVIDSDTKLRMKQILSEIQSGVFARNFILENQSGNVNFAAMRRRAAEHPMESVGARLRGLMPWLKDKQLVDRSKN